MNYIEFQIGGKLRGFKCGTKFLSDILSELDTNLFDLGHQLDTNPFKTRPLVVYFAHLSDCQRKSIPVTFDKDEVYGWFDDLDNGISNDNVVQLINVLIKSIKSHLPKDSGQEPKEEVSKKK